MSAFLEHDEPLEPVQPRPAPEVVLLYAQGVAEARVLSGALDVVLGAPSQHNWLEAVHPDYRATLARALAAGLFAAPFDLTYRLALVRPGHSGWVRDRIARLAAHGVLRIVSVVAAPQPPAIDRLPPAASATGEPPVSEERMLNALPDVLLVVQRDTTVVRVYGDRRQMLAAPDELVGRKFIERGEFTPAIGHLWTRLVTRAIESGRSQLFEYTLTLITGDRDCEARVVPLSRLEALVIVRDVSERNRLRERLQHQALHDDLTGLLTRSAFIERFNALLLERSDYDVALVILDLDNFHQINDTFGRSVGDTLLKVVANRITRRAGTEGLRGRVGPDQFALALVYARDTQARVHVEALASTLVAEIGNRMRVHGESLYLTASIGITLEAIDGTDATACLRNAEVALMRAKERGRNGYQFYDSAMGAAVHTSFNTEQSLRRALANGELACFYQPKIEVQGGAMRAIEALVRWPNGQGEMILPDRFIPLAERTGLIKPLGQFVLTESLRHLKEIQLARQRHLDLAVNVSIAQLRDPRFVDDVRAALKQVDLGAHRLTLEIAETALVGDAHQAIETLANLADLGVRIAIDDFGVGYGGLSWLKSLPIHEIKIDRSFIKGCAIDAYDAAIVSGLIDMAHNLGIQVVAEGVERADQIAFLTQVQCDAIQGYFLGQPMSVDELLRAERLWQDG